MFTKYCDEIFASGAETEEFFYRLGIKDGLRSKSTVKSVLEMMPGNREWMENICYDQKDEEYRY